MVVEAWGARDIEGMAHPNRARPTNSGTETDLLGFDPSLVGGRSGIRRIGRTE